MGNCCGDKEVLQGFEEEIEDEDMEEGYQRAEKPSDAVAFNINDLPKSQKQQNKLSHLQQLINHMKANERKGKKTLKITRIHGQGLPLPDPYILRITPAIYIGQWKYNYDINSTVPGGLGRLYREEEIMEGEIMTITDQDQKNRAEFKEHIAEQMVRQTKRRAKFFNKEQDDIIQEEQQSRKPTDFVRKLKVVLDGQGRIFSRSMQYTGYFTKSKLDGKGEVTIRYEKDIYHYKGDFAMGKKHGKGIETYKGTVYDGEFLDDLKEGKGTLILFISNKLQKQYQEQTKKMQEEDADRDPAEVNKCIEEFIQLRKQILQEPLKELLLKDLPWKGPQKQIKGKLFIYDSDFYMQHLRRTKYSQFYRGQFDDNHFQGYGRYTWFNGKCYDGFWKNGKMDGIGQFHWQKGGSYYQGQYKDDLKHGKGTIYWSLFKRYRGQWAHGLRHGYGELISIDPIYQEVNPEQQVEKNILSGLYKTKKTQDKGKVIVTVTGGLFNKDKLQEQYFQKKYTINMDIEKLKIELSKMTCKVKGLRFDEQEYKKTAQ